MSSSCTPCSSGAGAIKKLIETVGGMSTNRGRNDSNFRDSAGRILGGFSAEDRLRTSVGERPGTNAGNNHDALDRVRIIADESASTLNRLNPNNNGNIIENLLSDAEREELRKQDEINRQSIAEAIKKGIIDASNGGVNTEELIDRIGAVDAEKGIIGENKSLKSMNSWNLSSNNVLNLDSRIQGLRNRLFLKYMEIDFEYFNVSDIRYRKEA